MRFIICNGLGGVVDMPDVLSLIFSRYTQISFIIKSVFNSRSLSFDLWIRLIQIQ